ncbi:hypothetical protein J3A83DRAFT_4360214 [Scleroderma citrinum]
MDPAREQLLDAAKALCDDFSRKKDLDTILSHFSTAQPCVALEHGLPEFAPFLGRTFRGHEGVREYFSLIASLLDYRDMNFSDYVVDTQVRKVSVKGRARFTWKSTNESWDEIFVYVLDFDDEIRVYRYQVWADTAAAYLARKGQLGEGRYIVHT